MKEPVKSLTIKLGTITGTEILNLDWHTDTEQLIISMKNHRQSLCFILDSDNIQAVRKFLSAKPTEDI